MMKTQFLILLITSLMTPAITWAQPKEMVDMVISNATIYTVDSAFSKKESMAINEGKIVATGSTKEINRRYIGKEKINGKGKYIYPGFMDAHCHFSSYALERYECNLEDAKSFNEVISKLIAYQKKNKLSWIFGRGWDQNMWQNKNFPVNDTLNKLFPDIPVFLERIDGHALLCNQKALSLAHITAQSNVQGGVIEKKDDRLTGILIDNAMDGAEKIIPQVPTDIAIDYLKQLEKECYANGLTGFVDCGVPKKTIQFLKKLYDSNILSIGYTLLLSRDSETFAAYLTQGPIKDGQFQITGIKMYADGALGSRGACLLKPYSDDTNNTGFLLNPIADMQQTAYTAIKYNWQLCTHAIGDSANRVILHIYANTLKGKNNRRWRIEHAQVVDPNDMHLFGDYNIIPSVQPTHAISDMLWAGDRLGKKRLAHAYAYRDELKQNGWIALGTDFPVEQINPIATFYTAVFRKNKEGKPKYGFLSENALTREETLRGMTIWTAKSVFLENEKGSLEKGKDADIIILNTDLMKASREKIVNTKVLYTIVKGKIKYKR